MYARVYLQKKFPPLTADSSAILHAVPAYMYNDVKDTYKTAKINVRYRFYNQYAVDCSKEAGTHFNVYPVKENTNG